MFKQWLIIFFLVVFGEAFSQITDDFSDGDISTSPGWSGNTTKFIVNTSEQLQLNSIGADTSYVSTPNTSITNTEWNFWVKMSFAPSDNNYVKIYLVSDQPDLKVPVNGYYIRMGENGSFDSVDLWEQTGTTSTKLIDGINYHCGKSTNSLRIKVTRDTVGLWKLYSDTLGGTNFLSEGSVTSTTYNSTSYFGVSCKYTTSNSTKFYVDDVYVGPIIVDTIPPKISTAFAVSNTQLDIYFNEAVEKVSSEIPSNYSVDAGIGNPIVAAKDISDPALVHLTFSNTILNSQTYIITVNGVKDISDNAENNLSVSFVLPHQASANDIIVNEVLPDPNAGGVDFMEIYNRSDKVLDFSQLNFVSFDTLTNQLKSSYTISSIRKLFYPNEYYVLTTDPAVVKSEYNTTNPNGFIQMTTIPSMNVDAGCVGITDTSNTIIDKMKYYQSMHFALLNDTKGISLERINFDRSSDDKTNWHSAAENAGFATPGYKNSQNADNIYSKEISVSPEIFSPDNDGYNDVLSISYSFNDPGNIASIFIYDRNGRLIRSVAKNVLLGSAGSFSWDGITDKLEKAPIGIYIIHFQAFNSNGEVKNFKKIAVLASKLN